MAWRKPTTDDLAQTLSRKEMEAYAASSALDGADPVAELVARTAEMVRSYVRANTAVKMGPDGTVPAALISPLCDYAAYDVLKRQALAVGEDRRKAREQALELFKEVAQNDVTPESYVATEEEATAAMKAASPANAFPPMPPRVLD